MKWMSVRDFMRGGYRDITEPTVVANHGRPVFTVFPHVGYQSDEVALTYGTSDGTSLSSSSSATLTAGVSGLPERRA